MGRVNLKIKRVETTDIDIILDTYAKRKSGILIQEALLKEEKQKTRVKELEMELKEHEDKLNLVKELEIQVHEVTAIKKDLEGGLKLGSLHTPSQDPKKLRRRKAFLKKQEALVKRVTGEEKVMSELLVIADQQTLEEREKLISDIDVERAKVKQLEEDRKKIEKGAYQAIKEGLRDKLASNLDVECAKVVKQLEQNTKEMEKGASLTSKELASDEDDERANAKQSEKNDQFAKNVGQSLALSPELPMSMEEATPFDMVKVDKILSIEIGGMNVPLCDPSLLAAHPKMPPTNP